MKAKPIRYFYARNSRGQILATIATQIHREELRYGIAVASPTSELTELQNYELKKKGRKIATSRIAHRSYSRGYAWKIHGAARRSPPDFTMGSTVRFYEAYPAARENKAFEVIVRSGLYKWGVVSKSKIVKVVTELKLVGVVKQCA